MSSVASPDSKLPKALVERVMARLGFEGNPQPDLEGLRAVYAAWCRSVPFDNVRKIIHLRTQNGEPLPGSTAEDFLEAWLKFGTGGTCWSGAGALRTLLVSLGFNASRGIATMLAAPNLPPNHGTVRVTLDGADYLVDSAMLCVEPLRLRADNETTVDHPAWGLRCSQKEGKWYIDWRPLHKLDGFQCRLERFDGTAEEYHRLYDATRGWSPFNYEVTARLNRNDDVVGTAFGHAVTLRGDGTVERRPISHAERVRLLITEIGMSEEIVMKLPEDVPTPPPPGSRTAAARES